jgi:hypothetical protein
LHYSNIPALVIVKDALNPRVLQAESLIICKELGFWIVVIKSLKPEAGMGKLFAQRMMAPAQGFCGPPCLQTST